MTEFTELLKQAVEDDSASKEKLYELVYDELREAARRIKGIRSPRDPQTTVLVHEVLVRFEKGKWLNNFENRRVFFSVATRAMKQLLIDQYRHRKVRVDQNDRYRESLDAIVKDLENQNSCDFQALSDALDRLGAESPRQHAVVMHRFFGGLTIPVTAKTLGVSEGTVERDWRLARAKLYDDLCEIED